MGSKNAVLPEPLFGNGTINCLTYGENPRQPYNDNLCIFRALALHLHGTQRLEEETSASSRMDLNVDQDRNDETRNVQNFENGDFLALRT